jgi:class 3 adenylate cyclase
VLIIVIERSGSLQAQEHRDERGAERGQHQQILDSVHRRSLWARIRLRRALGWTPTVLRRVKPRRSAEGREHPCATLSCVGGASGLDGPGEDETAYRGFLFADLRGYTAFAERRGDRAAAELLDAYRMLVRDEVARHAGAEIRTEGDSFYVVFPSAQRAVACGMALVAAADAHSREHPAQPIRVGVGINAGETVQTGEGFVGAAVNLAARVCSQARAGEVLVTGPVRAASRGVSDVSFVYRGNKRLKGIVEPVPLYAARPGELSRTRLVPLWIVPAALAGVVLLLAVFIAVTWLPALSGQGVATSPPAGSSSLVTVSESPAPTTLGAFPNEEETRLLNRIPPDIATQCQRAGPEDRPQLSVDRNLAGLGGSGKTLVKVPTNASLACTIPSTDAPRAVYYWSTASFLDFSAAGMPEAIVNGDAGRLGIPRGNCATKATAFDRWAFGGTGGLLLCRTSLGQPLLEWTYDDTTIVARAIGSDAGSQALYDWWLQHGRFLRQ